MDYTKLVEKFGKIPAGLSQKAQIVPAYLTEEEFAMLKDCPRVGTVESRSKWPTIGGRRTYPLSGVLNEAEKSALNAFVKAYNSGEHATRTVAQKTNSEELTALRKKIKSLDGVTIEDIDAFDKATGYIKSEEDLKEEMQAKLFAQMAEAGIKLPKGFKFTF